MLTFRGAPSGKALEAWRDNFSLKVGATRIRVLVSKNIGLRLWMGFAIWLRLGKNVTRRNWEEGVPTLLGMKRWNPECVGLRDRAKIELW